MKMYVKCQPEAKEIYGKLEAREGINGDQVDRKIKHKRGRWIIGQFVTLNFTNLVAKY